MRQHKYILDKQGNPQPEPDVLKWGRWFEKASRDGRRVVARNKVGEGEVSTVFLGVDHNWMAVGEPILWETMVFGGPCDQEQDRCAGLWRDAEAMHAKMVARVRAVGKPGKKK